MKGEIGGDREKEKEISTEEEEGKERSRIFPGR